MRRSHWAACGFTLIVATVLLFAARPSWLLAQPAEHDRDAVANVSVAPPAGATCTVYLRGDAAGASFHDRLPDLGNLIARRGTVARADDTWLVLRDGDHQLYIPRTSIMLIDVAK